MTQPTTRVRLYKSRFIHVVRLSGTEHRTDCHIYDIAASDPHWLPDATSVTCRVCIWTAQEPRK